MSEPTPKGQTMKEPRQFTRKEIKRLIREPLLQRSVFQCLADTPTHPGRVTEALLQTRLDLEKEKSFVGALYEKIATLGEDLEQARKDRDDAAEVILNMLEGTPMEPVHHDGLMMHPGRVIISRIEQSKKEEERG